MKRLELTSKRQAIINSKFEEWLAVGLSTQPADFERAEAAIEKLYAYIGKKRPHFVRLDSPFAAEIYINFIAKVWPNADQLRGQLRDQLGDQLRGQLGDQLWDQLRDQLRGQLGDQLWDQLGDQLRGQLGDQLGGQPGDQLWGQLRDQLRGQLGDQLWDQKISYMGTYFYGQWDYYWSWLETGREIGVKYGIDQDKALTAHCEIMKSIGWWYPFDDFCIITNRPEIIALDDRNRLHGYPALRYRDGYELHAHHGVSIPADISSDRLKLTSERIDSEKNAEVRRVFLEWYGVSRYLKETKSTVIDSDKDMLGNTRRLLSRELADDEPIVMVEVTDSTPMPDGKFKTYLLRVDPKAYGGRAGKECHAAIASTWREKGSGNLFFKTPEEYRPQVET